MARRCAAAPIDNSVLAVTFKSLRVQVISVDGHSLDKPRNRPVNVAPGETIYLSSAQRYDILIDTTLPVNNRRQNNGVHQVFFEFQDWITRKRQNLGDGIREGFSYTTIEFPWV